MIWLFVIAAGILFGLPLLVSWEMKRNAKKEDKDDQCNDYCI